MLSPSASRSLAAAYLAVLFTLLGAALRLWALGSQSLWLDEVFTGRVAPLSLSGIIAAIRTDLDTPPLHPVLTHFFLALGKNDVVLRLPSALPAILCIPLMYVLAHRLLGQTSGLLAAALMACAPFAVYYAQEARMYSLALMLFLLAFYALVRSLDPGPPAAVSGGAGASAASSPGATDGHKRRPQAWWLVFTAAAALGLYTHFFAFLSLGLLCIYAVLAIALQWRNGRGGPARRHVLYLLLSLAGIALIYTPWLPVLLSFVRENYAASPYGQGWRANMTPALALRMITLMLGGYGAPVEVRWGVRLLFVLGLLFMLRRQPLLAVFSVVAIALPFGLIIAVNPGHFITDRYFIFLLPVLILGLAEGLFGIAGLAGALLTRLLAGRSTPAPRFAQVAPLVAAFIAVPILAAPGLARYFAEPTKPEWRELAQYVSASIPPSDLIVLGAFPHWDREPFDYYVQPEGRRVVYASQDRDLRRILDTERTAPWWIVFAGRDSTLGQDMQQALPDGFAVVPFRQLAVVRRASGSGKAVDDGRTILTALDEHIPRPYQHEVMRVIKGLASPDGDMGKPVAPPLPTGK